VPRAALYVRASTDKQTVENQRAELLQLAEARGFEPVISSLRRFLNEQATAM